MFMLILNVSIYPKVLEDSCSWVAAIGLPGRGGDRARVLQGARSVYPREHDCVRPWPGGVCAARVPRALQGPGHRVRPRGERVHPVLPDGAA